MIRCVWTSKDGTGIRICDMTDAHLLNAIRFVRKRFEHGCWGQLGLVASMEDGDGGVGEAFMAYSEDPSLETPIFSDLLAEMGIRRLKELPLYGL